MIHYAQNMEIKPMENVRGGTGKYDSTILFSAQEVEKTNLFAKNVLSPGVSIGVHPHGEEGEAYVILKGQAVVTEDGKDFVLGPGDAEYCTGGHTHGIRNEGPETLEFLAIIMK